MHPRRLLVLAVAVSLAATLALSGGCSGTKTERRTLTERERDSTIGASTLLPGAGVTKRALGVSDSTKARAERLQSEVEAAGR